MGPVEAQEARSAAPGAGRFDATNSVSQQGVKPDPLKQLEDELSRSLGGFAPKAPADPGLGPQYRPPVVVVPDRRTRDAEWRRRNWLLPDMDGTQPDAKDRDWLNGPDNPFDPKATKRNPLDDFYDRLNQGNSSRLLPRARDEDALNLTRSRRSGESGARDEANLPGSIRDSANRLQNLLDTAASAGQSSVPDEREGLSSLFRRSDRQLSPEEIREHKAYLNDYRKVLSEPSRAPATALTPLMPVSGSSPPGAPAGYSGFPSLMGSSPSKPFGSTPGMLTTVRNPTMMPDPNVAALNQWNPLYSPPKIEPPKPAPFAVPQAEAPRRRF